LSALSDYLNAHIPVGWTKRDFVRALDATIDRSTVYRYLNGLHSKTPPEFVLAAFAQTLGCSVVELREAAGVAIGEEEPWVPPLEANRLSRGQREALETFIRATVALESSGRGDASLGELGALGADAQMELRDFVVALREDGQDDLAERLEASLRTTSSASQRVRRPSTS
jgi:hypothetical protein